MIENILNEYNRIFKKIKDLIGNIRDLKTDSKVSLVDALNEIVKKAGIKKAEYDKSLFIPVVKPDEQHVEYEVDGKIHLRAPLATLYKIVKEYPELGPNDLGSINLIDKDTNELYYGSTVTEFQDIGNGRTRFILTAHGYPVDNISFGYNNYDSTQRRTDLVELKLIGVSVDDNDYMFSNIAEEVPEPNKLYIDTDDPDGVFKAFDWSNTFGMQGIFRPVKDFSPTSEDDHEAEIRKLKMVSKDRGYKFNGYIFNFQ